MIRLALSLLLIGLLATPLQARELSPVEGLEALRKVFAGLDSFSAQVEQEKQVRLLKKKIRSTGVIRFRKPDTFFMEIDPPYGSRVLLKDTVLTTLLTRDGTRQRIVLPPEQGLGRWIASLSRPVSAAPEGMTVSGEEKDGAIRLRILPGKKGGLREVGIVVEGGELRTLSLEEQSGDRTVMKLRKFRRNPAFSAADFTID